MQSQSISIASLGTFSQITQYALTSLIVDRFAKIFGGNPQFLGSPTISGFRLPASSFAIISTGSYSLRVRVSEQCLEKLYPDRFSLSVRRWSLRNIICLPIENCVVSIICSLISATVNGGVALIVMVFPEGNTTGTLKIPSHSWMFISLTSPTS